nr:hypothetical transcript [Hymenolepis microstoma]
MNVLRGLFKAPPIVGRSASHSLSRRKSLAGSQKVNRQEQYQDDKLQPRRAETFASGSRQRRQTSLDPKDEEGIENERGGGSVTYFTRLSTLHRPISTGDVGNASGSQAPE